MATPTTPADPDPRELRQAIALLHECLDPQLLILCVPGTDTSWS